MKIAFGSLASALWLAPSLLAAAEATPARWLQVHPSFIEKTLTYSGARVRIEGMIANGSRAAVAIRGPEREETFSRKVRAGPIWISSGRVHVQGTPVVLLTFSTDALRTILRREVIDEHQLDAASVAKRVRVEPPGQPGDALESHYLNLRLGEGRYQFTEGGIRLGPPGNPGTPFVLEFDWPRTAPSATYEVWLHEIRDGVVTGSTHVPLEVRRAGFPAWMAAFATRHASLYGLLAVVIALLAGFGIDFLATRIFGKRRVGAH